MDTQDRIARGKRAEIIMKELDELGVFKALKQDAVQAMLSSSIEELVERRAHVLAIDMLRGKLNAWLIDGQLAQKT